MTTTRITSVATGAMLVVATTLTLWGAKTWWEEFGPGRGR